MTSRSRWRTRGTRARLSKRRAKETNKTENKRREISKREKESPLERMTESFRTEQKNQTCLLAESLRGFSTPSRRRCGDAAVAPSPRPPRCTTRPTGLAARRPRRTERWPGSPPSFGFRATRARFGFGSRRSVDRRKKTRHAVRRKRRKTRHAVSPTRRSIRARFGSGSRRRRRRRRCAVSVSDLKKRGRVQPRRRPVSATTKETTTRTFFPARTRVFLVSTSPTKTKTLLCSPSPTRTRTPLASR
mmetsp:Transcript_8325/g.35319  ORF Transcript_8325/g.35319 Transcript_8325/m.35319 type:complete len:246 (-) Transcript_8325:2216-2953(-)